MQIKYVFISHLFVERQDKKTKIGENIFFLLYFMNNNTKGFFFCTIPRHAKKKLNFRFFQKKKTLKMNQMLQKYIFWIVLKNIFFKKIKN